MDEVDRGQELEQRDRDEALKATLARIAAANSKAHPATSRDCASCREPIETQRLRAQPYAERCIECQNRWEKYGV